MPLSDTVIILILILLGLPLFCLAGQVIKRGFKEKNCILLILGASLYGVF